MFDLTNFIPQVAAAKIALTVAAVVAIVGGSVYIGYQWGSKALPEAVVAQQIDLAENIAERTSITAQSTVQYIDRLVKVREEARVIIQEVPVYVKDTCSLSVGLRGLHDAATQGQLPVPQPVTPTQPGVP